MKWFKHISTSYNDEKLSQMTDMLGMEGYGFWWRTLEVVAEKMDETNNYSCSFSSKKWGSFYGFSAKKFEKFARIFEKFSLFSVEILENSITVSIPNLLKYKDEWSKKKAKISGVTPKELWCKEKEEEKEEDIYINPPLNPQGGGESFLENSSPFEFLPQVQARVITPPPPMERPKKKKESTSDDDPDFEKFWSAYPRKTNKGAAKKAYAKAKKAGILPDDLVERTRRKKYRCDQWQKDDGKFIPHPATWLNQEGWLDADCEPSDEVKYQKSMEEKHADIVKGWEMAADEHYKLYPPTTIYHIGQENLKKWHDEKNTHWRETVDPWIDKLHEVGIWWKA